ncbi:class I SAM-dependent methyltransferase [Mesorhizobium sp. M0968]|uniref:class I SAM-dependent methyltransferase n=1 Tax=Mesorhizobium sp. M0968 TaxID=2957037 RepID=UPI0033362542
MDRIIYERLAVNEEIHWWFTGRRTIIERLLVQLGLPPKGEARILEVGCGTGGNLCLLQEFGAVDAVEFDAAAREIANRKSGLRIGFAALPDQLAAHDGSYDLIALLDVIEHIEQDVASLAALKPKLRRAGAILITVPAHPWMWSAHDEVHHHKRRYTRATLRSAIERAGLVTVNIGYFNTSLFPLGLLRRLTSKLTGGQTHDDIPPSAPLNQLFATIFAFERHLVGRVPLPIGLSLFAMARRSEDREPTSSGGRTLST